MTEFAAELDHPRRIYQLPNGDVLVAESNKPPRGKQSFSITNFVAKRIMTRAGAGTASANRITLLRDTDGDGVAETKSAFLTGFLVDEKARGRPVSVLLDQRGGLLVADDVGNRIWRVAPK